MLAWMSHEHHPSPTSSLSASSASSASASSSCRRMPGENRWEIHPFNQKIWRIPKNIIYKWLENHLQLVISGEFMWIQDLGLVFMYINYITEDILYRSLKLHGPQTHTHTDPRDSTWNPKYDVSKTCLNPPHFRGFHDTRLRGYPLNSWPHHVSGYLKSYPQL